MFFSVKLCETSVELGGTTLCASMIALPACGGDTPTAEAPIDRDTFVATYVDLRLSALGSQTGVISDSERSRERLGPDRLLMVDAISAFDSADEVKRMLPVFHECDVHWLEAPLPLDDLEGHRALSDCGIPLGVGDLGLTAPAEWRPYFESGVVGIAQPEVTQIGGLTGLRGETGNDQSPSLPASQSATASPSRVGRIDPASVSTRPVARSSASRSRFA